jgi:basic membrane protein A
MATTLVFAAAAALVSCKKDGASALKSQGIKIGLVTDVGGRGDQSFNDSALRGLELWAAGKKLIGSEYQPVTPAEVAATIPAHLASRGLAIEPMPIIPLVLQSKAQEDYEPNLQLLVDRGVALSVATGFLLEAAVLAVARRNLNAKFLLIDSPLIDSRGAPVSLPNVRTVVFREEQGSFLVGALAGLATQTGKIGFVGGMEIPLIKKFEAGFKAGVLTTRPSAARELLVAYTGSFDNVATGKQVAQDLLSKGVDVVFQAAGSDGLGAIQAVKEARDSGRQVYVIGVDSDQWHLAPTAVLTSMIKHVDLVVYLTIRDLVEGKFSAGNSALGLKEDAVWYSEVRVDFPGKKEALERVEALRKRVIAGEIQVPSNLAELTSFRAPP